MATRDGPANNVNRILWVALGGLAFIASASGGWMVKANDRKHDQMRASLQDHGERLVRLETIVAEAIPRIDANLERLAEASP